MSNVRLVSFSTAGHRASYNEVLEKALQPYGVRLGAQSEGASTDFFAMLDDDILAFAGAALKNTILRRRTVGLFFRPAECFKTTKIKYRLKRVLFSLLRRIPGTTILTILPFALDNRFAQISNGWIHDPQLWDMAILPGSSSAPEANKLIQEITTTAAGRKIVVALGAQRNIKGFDFFAEIWARSASVREKYFFVSAGEIASECELAASVFRSADGLIIDRFVSNEELLELYQTAHIVWSCYTPDYDQASGIFGRAFQFGKPTIVREGSFLAPLAKQLSHPVLALSHEQVEQSALHLLAWTPVRPDLEQVQRKIALLHQRDIETLATAFGALTKPGGPRHDP